MYIDGKQFNGILRENSVCLKFICAWFRLFSKTKQKQKRKDVNYCKPLNTLIFEEDSTHGKASYSMDSTQYQQLQTYSVIFPCNFLTILAMRFINSFFLFWPNVQLLSRRCIIVTALHNCHGVS